MRTIVVYHFAMGKIVAVVRLRSGGNRRWEAPAGKVKGRRAGVRIAVGSEGPSNTNITTRCIYNATVENMNRFI